MPAARKKKSAARRKKPAVLAGVRGLDKPAVMEYYGWRVSGTRRDLASFVASGAVSCSGEKRERFERLLADLRAGRDVCRDWDTSGPDPLGGERVECDWEEWAG